MATFVPPREEAYLNDISHIVAGLNRVSELALSLGHPVPAWVERELRRLSGALRFPPAEVE